MEDVEGELFAYVVAYGYDGCYAYDIEQVDEWEAYCEQGTFFPWFVSCDVGDECGEDEEAGEAVYA